MQWRRPRKDELELVLIVTLLALFLIVVFRVGFALAQEAMPGEVTTKLDTNPGEFAEDLYQAFTAKEWGIFVGCLIMMIVWFVRLFVLIRLPSDWLPWVSSGMGVLLSISVDLTSKVPWWKAILNGLLVGAAASGMWSMVGKKVLPSERKKKESIGIAESQALRVHDHQAAPKVVVVKDIGKPDSKLEETTVLSDSDVKRLLREGEITEPDRKVVLPDDTKPSS